MVVERTAPEDEEYEVENYDDEEDDDGEEDDDEDYDDWEDDDNNEKWEDRRDFEDPGGVSALRAVSPRNPRNLPCPTCGQENTLTPKDKSLGYQCNACADALERGYP